MFKLGVQISIAGKIYYSVDRAKSLGCNTMQIFARNPRQFRKSSLKKEDINIFRSKIKEAKISPLIIHTPYTLNLAAAKRFLHRVSIREFIQDIKEAHLLGAKYIVIHTGNFRGDEVKGLGRIAFALRDILENTRDCHTDILLENTAGDGSSLGYKFSHHRFILQRLGFNRKVGLCLDTAHAWCAGYRINTKSGLDSFIKEINREIGIERIKVIHLNDTLDDLGTRKDKHFHIGKGKIGEKGFGLIVNHPLLKKLPFILETPKKKDPDDLMNLSVVRRLYKNELPRSS